MSAEATKNRVVSLFKDALGYAYLEWQDGERSKPIEEEVLNEFLTNQQGYSADVAREAIANMMAAATALSGGLEKANHQVYSLLRNGMSVGGTQVKFVNWDNPIANDISLVKNVKVTGGKTLDIVLYLNGMAIGVINLESSENSLESGIQEHLANQSGEATFFSTVQLLFAGNEQGLKYATVGSAASDYQSWQQDTDQIFEYQLDKHLYQVGLKERMFELIHECKRGVVA